MTAGFNMVWCELDDTEIFSPFACNKVEIFKKRKEPNVTI
jgi:hypothetical protein